MNNPIDCSELPPSIEPVIARLLAKNPAERYANAGEVIVALSEAINEEVPSETAAIRESYLQASNFVGRETELTTLKANLATIPQGDSAFYLVGGESGVGKSRLVDELRTIALVDGFQVLRGQAIEQGGLPWQLWRGVTPHLLLNGQVDDLQAAILKDIVPNIDTLLARPIPTAPELMGSAYGQRIMVTLVDLLRQFDQPVLLILEDLQWATESLSILQHILKIRDQLPNLMVIGTYRNDEQPNLPTELEGMTVLSLPRLDEAAIAKLTTAMLGENEQQSEIIEFLTHETEGNTFFMVEVVRALAEEAGNLNEVGRMTLPLKIFTGNMQDLLHRRLAKISDRYQALVQVAAIAGRQIDQHLIETIFPSANIQEWLTQCEAAVVFDVQDNQWRFTHDKLRETVLSELSSDEKPTLHRQLAKAIETGYPDNEDYAEALLEHWHQAGDLAKELIYLHIVAKSLVNISGQYDYARSLLQRTLEALPADDARCIELLSLQAFTHERENNYEQAKEIALQTKDLANQHQDQAGYASSLNSLGSIASDLSENEEAITYLTEALTIYKDLQDQEGLARTLNYLGMVNARQSNFSEAREYYQQSIAISKALGDEFRMAYILNNLGMIDSRQGDYLGAQSNFQESLALRRKVGDRFGTATNLSNLGAVSSELGELDQAILYLEESLNISQTIGDKRGMGGSLENMGIVAKRKGDYAEAKAYFEKSLAVKQSIGYKLGMAFSYGNLGRLAYTLGDYSEAQNRFLQIYAIFTEIGNKRGMVLSRLDLAFVYLKLGNEKAARLLTESLKEATELQMAATSLEILAGFVWVYVNQEKHTRAAELAGFIQNHDGFFGEVKERFDEIEEHIKDCVDASDDQPSAEKGVQLDLDGVVQEILTTFGAEIDAN